jgi:ethanolamine ammonia-lyase small subunit
MNDWAPLRRVTQARIGLARAGSAVSTQALLEFHAAHARARDAVWCAWDIESCEQQLRAAGASTLRVASAAPDRATYLKRPDLGRRLAPESVPVLEAARDALHDVTGATPEAQPATLDVALVLSDGLSATAVHEHGVSTMLSLLTALQAANLRCSPVVLAQYGRVALSDEIGHILGARSAVIVLGERPGLSAADGLGMYLTHAPTPGKTDAQRNCISNVREPAGLSARLAALRLTALLRRSLALGMSGVELKDDGLVLP